MHRLRRIFLWCLLPALFPPLARAQAQAGPMVGPAESGGVYDNLAAGLHLQLQEAFAAAKDRDRSRLESLIREMEIPNYETWFKETFGEEKGRAWAGSYALYLGENERELAGLLIRLSDQDGRFSVGTLRSDQTVDGTFGSAMVDALRGPTEIFFAEWKRPETQRLAPTEIGYFFFVERKFRWFARPDVNGITYPICVYCPNPYYPPQARAQHLNGNVVLSVVVEPDGTTDSIKLVKTSDPVFVDFAIEAIKRWRFKPAVDANGQAVPTRVPVELTFRTNYDR